MFKLLIICFLFLCSCASNNKEIAFYVSPDGNDANTGSIETPFRSIEKAKNEVRLYKQKNGITGKGITVHLRQGIYPISQTLHFKEEDSGKDNIPVTYKAYQDEEVLFVGGKVINNFHPISDKEAKSRIDASLHNKIWQADLKKNNIGNYEVVQSSGFGVGTPFSGMEFFFNGEPMCLSRYPNEGEWMIIASVPQSGDTLFNEGGDGGVRFDIPVGRNYGRFKYDGKRPAGWLKNDDVWLHGYWTMDWADLYVKVRRIDAASNEFVLAKPQSSVYGYTKAQRYYALNILEELDSPGEWYIDKKTGQLYFWPPSSIEKGLAVISELKEPMIFLDQTNQIKFEGIIFECTRGEAVKIAGGNNNLVGGCTIRNIGSNGVIIDGGHHNGITGCDIYNIGDGGIILIGGDRKTLTNGNNFATNNHIHHYSRINSTYRPAISLQGVGNLVAHNHIHDAPHTGVIFGGNNHVLEFNEIHDIAKETGDVGAFYIGRNWTERGNTIRHNYFHHLHGPGSLGVMAVYLDDMACGTTIFGNIFYKAGRSVFVGGGHDNITENNIFINCEASIHLDARGMTWEQARKGGNWKMVDKLEEVNYTHPPYSTQYPSLAKLLDWGDPGRPRGNVFRTNLSYGGEWKELDSGVDEVVIENNFIEKEIPSYINIEEHRFYPENEQILNDLKFEKIPFDSIGLYVDKYRRVLPQ